MYLDKQKVIDWLRQKSRDDNRKSARSDDEDDAIAYANFALATEEVIEEIERGTFDCEIQARSAPESTESAE